MTHSAPSVSEFEEQLRGCLPSTCHLAQSTHDALNQTVRFCVLTRFPRAAWRTLRKRFGGNDLLTRLRASYQLQGTHPFVNLWPPMDHRPFKDG